MKYADYFCKFLADNGYTHVFMVAGGNIMHLIEAASKRFHIIPVSHEVSAVIAVEYFNKSNRKGEKAFALVTAGPGLTNSLTGIAGAYLDSREVLVIGGQVKTSDLKSSSIRQRGIQEVDGVGIAKSITIRAARITKPLTGKDLSGLLVQTDRPGPVFLELPLDIQAFKVPDSSQTSLVHPPQLREVTDNEMQEVYNYLRSSKRPILLIGGGVSLVHSLENLRSLGNLGIPIMTTWNGAENYAFDLPNFWGRPNTWGQRAANVLIQQCDLLISIGTRLGLQQTGFGWQTFCPLAKIIQIDVDENEILKGHPRVDYGLPVDAKTFIEKFLYVAEKNSFDFSDWLNFGTLVWESVPQIEYENETSQGFISPHRFVGIVSKLLSEGDVIIPCSSGGAFTVTMQALMNKFGQSIITNKGLASMGYGLAGALGAAISTNRRTILIEGDGGFLQNIQELGTVALRKMNIKIFIFANNGYASIRITQQNYFQGNYIGCDESTGLGFPNWKLLAQAFGIEFVELDAFTDLEFQLTDILLRNEPCLVIVPVDPSQTYWPKISSRVQDNGSMESNPLHKMTPELSSQISKKIFRFLEL